MTPGQPFDGGKILDSFLHRHACDAHVTKRNKAGISLQQMCFAACNRIKPSETFIHQIESTDCHCSNASRFFAHVSGVFARCVASLDSTGQLTDSSDRARQTECVVHFDSVCPLFNACETM